MGSGAEVAQRLTASTVGAVIVNHNAGAHLIDAVRSVRREGIRQIVIVDNDSTDGSTAAALAQFPELQSIRLPNPGYGAANNEGAARLDTDYIWCLNPDIVVHDDALAPLVAVLDDDPSVAVVGPMMLNVDGTPYPSARSFPVLSNAVGHALFGVAWPANRWSRAYKRLDLGHVERSFVDWVSGAAMLVRRDAFDGVGGFDADYFMYMEDVDLCWRLGQAGWKVVFEPAGAVTHVGGVSTSRRPYRMLKEHHRSAIRYNARTTTGWQTMLLPLLVGGLAARLPMAWLHQYVVRRRAARS